MISENLSSLGPRDNTGEAIRLLSRKPTNSMSENTNSQWAQTRRENALLQAQRQKERQAAEANQAKEYLRRFVVAAQQSGLAEEQLFVKGYGGKGQAKTALRGWYLKADRSMAVDVDGNFYLLIAELTLIDRLRGVTLSPSDPPLILGAGGRDGESIDLVDALKKLLPDWKRLSQNG